MKHQVKPMCAPRSLLQSTSLLGTRWSNATWRATASATHITWRAAASATPITKALAAALAIGIAATLATAALATAATVVAAIAAAIAAAILIATAIVAALAAASTRAVAAASVCDLDDARIRPRHRTMRGASATKPSSPLDFWMRRTLDEGIWRRRGRLEEPQQPAHLQPTRVLDRGQSGLCA